MYMDKWKILFCHKTLSKVLRKTCGTNHLASLNHLLNANITVRKLKALGITRKRERERERERERGDEISPYTRGCLAATEVQVYLAVDAASTADPALGNSLLQYEHRQK